MRRPPLAAMAMAGEDQIKMVPVVEELHNVRCVGQEQGEPVRMGRRHLVETGAMERRIIDADNGQLASIDRQDRGLVDQQRNLVPVGQRGKFVHPNAAIMVVVPEGHVEGRDPAETGQELEEGGESASDIEQIPGDEDPVRFEIRHDPEGLIMPDLIAIEMQIGEVDGPAAGQTGMCAIQPGQLRARLGALQRIPNLGRISEKEANR